MAFPLCCPPLLLRQPLNGAPITKNSRIGDLLFEVCLRENSIVILICCRFDPESTNGEGPKRLRNLYFLYLLELRAIAKAAPFLEDFHYYTGNAEDDAEVKAAVQDFVQHTT
jgi:hypothetical protein